MNLPKYEIKIIIIVCMSSCIKRVLLIVPKRDLIIFRKSSHWSTTCRLRHQMKWMTICCVCVCHTKHWMKPSDAGLYVTAHIMTQDAAQHTASLPHGSHYIWEWSIQEEHECDNNANVKGDNNATDSPPPHPQRNWCVNGCRCSLPNWATYIHALVRNEPILHILYWMGVLFWFSLTV